MRLKHGEAGPLARWVKFQRAGTGRRVPGAQQVRGVADRECAVAGAHQQLGGRRGRAMVEPPAARAVVLAEPARAIASFHAGILLPGAPGAGLARLSRWRLPGAARKRYPGRGPRRPGAAALRRCSSVRQSIRLVSGRSAVRIRSPAPFFTSLTCVYVVDATSRPSPMAAASCGGLWGSWSWELLSASCKIGRAHV